MRVRSTSRIAAQEVLLFFVAYTLLSSLILVVDHFL